VTLTKSALEGLLAIAQPKGLERSLPQLYFDTREAIIVAANPTAMLWKHDRFHTSADAFSISSDACAEAVECAPHPSTPIEIWITDSHVHSRRRTTLMVCGEPIVEMECLAYFPHPRGVLAPLPNARRAEFAADAFNHLRSALCQVSGCKAQGVYVMPRGTAPAFVVNPNAETMGFFLPQPRDLRSAGSRNSTLQVPVSGEEYETARQYASDALRTFKISETVRTLVSITPPSSRRLTRALEKPAVAATTPAAEGTTTDSAPTASCSSE